MNTLRYFRIDIDPSLGAGTAYMEFQGERVSRQIEIHNDLWYYSDDPKEYFPDVGPALCDQPLSSLQEDEVVGPSDEITQEEFEEAWIEAQRHQKK